MPFSSSSWPSPSPPTQGALEKNPSPLVTAPVLQGQGRQTHEGQKQAASLATTGSMSSSNTAFYQQ